MTYLHRILFFALSVLLWFADGQLLHQSLSIDNEVIEDAPKVECDSEKVSMYFNTKNQFQGHIFVRGHYKDSPCHKDYSANRENGGNFEINFANCGMRRKREANPRGLQISTTVIVSFHRSFITQIDRAYHIQCFYREGNYGVSANLEVSMIPTIDLDTRPPMPTCDYNVVRDGLLGDPVRFARVGDKVYHKWTCDYPMPDMYCMKIHSCTVDDGEVGEHLLIDEDGCSKDPVLLNDLQYISDLMAGTHAEVFKFADRAHLYFQCRVMLSLKTVHGGICPKPVCDHRSRLRGHRVRKDVTKMQHKSTQEIEFDLVASPVLVIDIEEDGKDDQTMIRLFNGPNKSTSNLQSGLPNFMQPAEQLDGICLSEVAFGSFISALIIVCLSCLVVTAYICIKLKLRK